MKESLRENIISILITITIVAVFLGMLFALPWFRSSQEAKSYRKFCKTEVTTWDALWLDLRIDECNN